MSRKRSLEEETTRPEPSARLRAIADVAYDREQIDHLLEHYRASAPPSEVPSEMICCPREYEESYLREPVAPERPCARGPDCEGLSVMCDQPFVLREFVYPGQSVGEARTLCLLCRRDEISKAYYRYETGHCQEARGVRVTDYFNLVGIPGEYDVRDCIMSNGKYTGIPLPVVLHIRSAYESITKDGVRYLTQTRMRYPDRTDALPGSFLARRATLPTKVAPSKNQQAVVSP